jgi:hypothetical protein
MALSTLKILLHYWPETLLLIGLWGMLLCLPAQILINWWNNRQKVTGTIHMRERR